MPSDPDKVIARIYNYLEHNDVENAVMACVRVARAVRDYVNAAVFLRELYPDKYEVARALRDDMADLRKEARAYVLKYSAERWLETHTVDIPTPEDDPDRADGTELNVLKLSMGELEAELQQLERAISDLTLPQGMAPYDVAAFTDRMHSQRAAIRWRIGVLQTVKSRVKTRCLNYAVQIGQQLSLQRKTQGFLEGVQNDVNNYFKVRSDDVFSKLRKATQLAAAADDAENSALLLTEVRRALKSVADYFYPPVPGEVMCRDNVKRLMGDQQYLNRLQEFVGYRVAPSTSKEVLQEQLAYLISLMRRLNDLASKGVHTVTTFSEAKQGLVSLYFFVFNLCQHLPETTQP